MTASDTAARNTRGGPAALTDQVRAEQVRLLYANGGFPMLITLVVGGAVAWLFVHLHAVRPVVAWAWIAAMALHTFVRLWVRRRYLSAMPPEDQWRGWADRFVLGALAGGLTWGLGGLWLLPAGRFDLQMLLVSVLMAAAYGAMSGFGSYLPAFYALFLPAFLPVVGWFALQGDVVHEVCVGLFLLWMPTVTVIARRYNANLVLALKLRFENAALVDRLTIQKAIAEQASLAKSRFLASASHDLRQPVHALGMFVGALRNHRLPKRSVALIDHLDGSIGALDSLFTSLLDISKLDAGVVESRIQVVPLWPLLARICADLEGEAAAKGVRLTLAQTSVAVHSDPGLLERVLRNLIGNAVRYTERGRVLVGCRRRAGGIGIEVWDTGPGIADRHREAIFEEFYQLSNPDRDRAKGLGLGLAIVRRLTDILDHPLGLESSPGRGSVFRVEAPRAPTVQRPDAPVVEALAAARTGLILAIDDEALIRAAMSELLRGWGHQVITAGGGDEAVAALDGRSSPDLIICDYRLRDGENGLETIRRLQARLGDAIPAILVTGDTAADRIREAQASGYPLLHKPLSHGRLRAAVTSLLRQNSKDRAVSERRKEARQDRAPG